MEAAACRAGTYRIMAIDEGLTMGKTEGLAEELTRAGWT
jgi:hypothetical protein